MSREKTGQTNDLLIHAFSRGFYADRLFALIARSSMNALVPPQRARDRGHSRDPSFIQKQLPMQFSKACRTRSTLEYVSLSRIILRYRKNVADYVNSQTRRSSRDSPANF